MSPPILLIIALCAALNLALGSIAFLLKLPVYLDMVGTILCALLLATSPHRAFSAAAAAGVLSFFIGGIVNPYLPWFAITVVAVAGLTAYVTGRSAPRFYSSSTPVRSLIGLVIAFGILTGLIAAIVSAPVVVYLFGGVTGSGSALIVAYFLKTGHQLLQATLLSGMAAEPVDKTLQLALAVLLFRATPLSLIARIRT